MLRGTKFSSWMSTVKGVADALLYIVRIVSPHHYCPSRTGGATIPLPTRSSRRAPHAGTLRPDCGRGHLARPSASLATVPVVAPAEPPEESVRLRGLTLVRDYVSRLAPPVDAETGLSAEAAAEAARKAWAAALTAETAAILPDLKFHDLVFGRELGRGAFGVATAASARQSSRWSQGLLMNTVDYGLAGCQVRAPHPQG